MPLADVLARLEPLQRHVVRLIYIEGRSHREAAELLEVERGVVAASLAGAYARIARALGDDVEARPVADDPLDLTVLAEPPRTFPSTEIGRVGI